MLISFFAALGIENGGRKRVSSETVSSRKQRKCQDKKFFPVNAVLSLYLRRKIAGDVSLGGTWVGRCQLGILPVTTAGF